MQLTWTVFPDCQSSHLLLLHSHPLLDNSSSSLCSLHLSLRLRRSFNVRALHRVFLSDRFRGRFVHSLRLSVPSSPPETPSPPYSPTSACPSSNPVPNHLNHSPASSALMIICDVSYVSNN